MNRYYHQNLDTSTAERLLKEEGVDGSYLVRPSRSSPGCYSLSIRRKDMVTHIKIKKNGDLYSLQAGGGGFPTLNDLIQHHSHNPICEKSGEVFELKQPFGPANKITERWFHGSIKGLAAEKLIRENGVNGSFLVRESHSRIGDYVLTVRIKEDNKNDQVAHVMIYHRDNKYDVGGGEKFDTLKKLVEHYQQKPMVESNGQVVNMRFPFNSTKTTALDLDVRIKELSETQPSSRRDGFDEEFEHLQHQECKLLYSKKLGQEDKNISKNRYRNILPFDHTRVVLKKPYYPNNNDGDYIQNDSNRLPLTPPASSNSDYINANHIKLVDSEVDHISEKTKPLSDSKCYIAAQGPINQTINDFWWMVWQEKSECIIMATREMENERNKCIRYWPTMQQRTLSAGPLTVEILNDTSYVQINNGNGPNIINGQTNMDYICREFEISDPSGLDHKIRKHRVKHYQYIAWPDQSIPEDPASILNFIKLINRHGRPRGPMIVHCSAGIGRSGTLIVIDMLIDQLKHHGLNHEIDIQRIVQTVRAQRPGLVQTIAQYRFIYHAIQSYVSTMKSYN